MMGSEQDDDTGSASGSESSLEPSDVTPRLHECLGSAEIEMLHQIYHQQESLRSHELRAYLRQCKIVFTDEQFDLLFRRIDADRNNRSDWNEFISFLINGFRDDDPYNQKESLNLPIEGLPKLHDAIHRYPIIRIRFNPTVMPDRSVNYQNGSYITTSKEGTVIYWTPNFEMQHVEKSKNPNLKVSKTWVLDCISLPDVRIVCTASIERDLRFYDTTANNFDVRIIISRLPYEVTVMAYWFGETEERDCRLVLGDAGGNVWLIEFNPVLRGPFQSKPGTALLQMTWADVVAGKLDLMRVKQFPRVHQDIVRQVDYSETMNAIFSAAECRSIGIGQKPAPGLVISDLGVQKTQTVLRMTKGVTCFAFDRDNTIIATGGPDCMLRLWNHIMPKKPVAILPGHHSGIVFIFLQDEASRIYTIDRNKFVKVWDTKEQSLMQTFIVFSSTLTDHTPITAYYNDCTRQLCIAGMKLATISCCPLLKLDQTDGYTHSRQVSVILYNDLFRTIVTCGFDSFIIVWDPWTGKRQILIKEAHTRMAHGELLRVEVTAACFDPKKQLLLTGARDGTLKVWNFNNGVCVRNLNIEFMCEVTAVFWFPERMLAMGWNKHVTEFSDTAENELGDGKLWDVCHLDDILSAAAREPQTLATSSYAGELVLWTLETGQPYRKFDVEKPTKRIKIAYDGQKVKLPVERKFAKSYAVGHVLLRRQYARTKSSIARAISIQPETEPKPPKEQKKSRYNRTMSIIQLPAVSGLKQKNSVNAMVFLSNRPMDPEYGTLMVAVGDGRILVFSHHILSQGYMEDFLAIHMAGDVVTTLQTDAENRLLFVGTALGYIKTWLICNYCVPEHVVQHINMPKLRLEFPFLIKERWLSRAKRTVRKVLNPLLVNSFRGHTTTVTRFTLLEEPRLLISASSDKTARIWTMSGRYIGTLGSPLKWQLLDPNTPTGDDYPYRMPPDIKRVASSATFKVMSGGTIGDPMGALIAETKRRKFELESEVRHGEALQVYGKPLMEPILGHNLQLPEREDIRRIPTLDTSMPFVPIYGHLDYIPASIVEMPGEPELLKKLRAITFMQGSKKDMDENGDGASDDEYDK